MSIKQAPPSATTVILEGSKAEAVASYRKAEADYNSAKQTVDNINKDFIEKVNELQKLEAARNRARQLMLAELNK